MTNKFVKKAIVIASVTSMLCAYSVSASAATYTSSTKYYNGAEKVNVSTTVSGLENGDEVTYLAFGGGNTFDPATSKIVYVNQYTTADTETTSKTFSYVTDAANIGSIVKMAKSDSNFANVESINPFSEENKIQSAKVKFNITVDSGSYFAAVDLTPGAQWITLPIKIAAGKEIATMTIGKTTYTSEDVIVTSDNIQFEYTLAYNDEEITGSITTQAIEDYKGTAPTVIGAFKNKEFSETINDETVAGYAYAVLADATNTPIGNEYGIALSKTASFEDAEEPSDALYLKSSGRGTDNKFAVVYVDDADAAGTVYYATYMKDAEGTITFGDMGTINLDK